jgi:hypothetical protein
MQTGQLCKTLATATSFKENINLQIFKGNKRNRFEYALSFFFSLKKIFLFFYNIWFTGKAGF